MTLPRLESWPSTSAVLHQVASLVGPVHKALLPHRNNYLHLPMMVLPDGLESQILPGGGKIHLDLKEGAVTYRPGAGGAVRFPFGDHTQASLFDALLGALEDDGMGQQLGLGDPLEFGPGADLDVGQTGKVGGDLGSDRRARAVVAKLERKGTAGRHLTLEGLTGREPLALDLAEAGAFADVLYSMFTALARFRARLEGPMTPLIVWPEHFDLSTLWFPPSNPEMDDHEAHISVGFAPFTPGQYEYPYLYAYAYPYPEDFDPPSLPEPAFWHREGWTGAVVPYREIAGARDHEAFVEEMAADLFRVLRRVLES